MAIKLSVLIATMHGRAEQFRQLMQSIHDQYDGNEVEYVIEVSGRCIIGAKRNRLLQQATGEYIVFIDDDDLISPDYISKILTAIETKPDCIGISGTITTNGANEQQWHISKEFGRWFMAGETYFRTPNHISPVRRELALQAGFPEISHGEDYAYSMALLPLLKTEAIIDGNLYTYQYRNDK